MKDERSQSMHTDAQRAYTHPLRDASQTVAALRKSLESFRYHRLVEEIRAIVERELPAGSSLLVISKGDARLLEFTEHRAGHFPQTPEGEYAGYYPASGREAVAELEELRRARGYEYLLIPATAEWWLKHYGELGEYLREGGGEVWRDRHCLIFLLPEHDGEQEGLHELQEHWDEFGKRDPLWAILTYPEKRNGKWSKEEFFRTGEWEIDNLLAKTAGLGVPFKRGRALDFGCGVGRLTQSLCRYFERCDGVDIAPSMLALARRFNRHGEKCCYHLNRAPHLKLFPDESFDFIYSNIVLQHIKPEYVRRYLREFLRVLATDGLLIFQMPTAPGQPSTAETETHASEEVLPESAFRARLTIARKSLRVKASAILTLSVRVRNESEVEWPQTIAQAERRGIWLGNHWLDEQGRLLVNDDGKTRLTKALRPGEETELELHLNTPQRAGRYLLELDLLQDGIAWFKQRGSETKLLRVTVTEGAKESLVEAGGEQVIVPVMEMHGLGRDQVAGWLLQAGGVLVDIGANNYVPGWTSYEYYVTR